MKKALILSAALGALAMAPSAAFACDLDGLPGAHGMHRFNPFASAIRTISGSPEAPQRAQERVGDVAGEMPTWRETAPESRAPAVRREAPPQDRRSADREVDSARFLAEGEANPR